MRESIRFVRQGKIVEIADLDPMATLLDHLRLTECATGTKEGCGEGDCGACTVAIGRSRGGKVVYEAVNSCIQLLGMVDGTEIVAVEDLASGDTLHPVQAAMVEKHGSQCGFCTPGFVMSIFALYQHSEGPVARGEINDWIAGNLCRCTGYKPIIDAALSVCEGPRADKYRAASADTAGLLDFLSDDKDIFIGDDTRFFAAPASVEGLAALYQKHPTAVIVAGGTDVGLWITKQLRDLPKIIHIGRVKGLDGIEDTGREVLIGATATYAKAEPYMRAIDPDLGELFRRIGSKQVRASGTVGGNVANGSPIGDTPPALIALGATMELRRGDRARALAVEDFYIEYGKQNRASGEFVTGLMVPKLKPGQVFRCYKITKRFDQDISSVMGAFRFTLDADSVIREARIAYGGMAGIPKRAKAAEAALHGTSIRDSAAWSNAFAALRLDFAPLDDHRASANYRAETAHALLGKALLEAAGTPTGRTRLIGRREEFTDAAE
ncbi:xanthine dehydrogenase small subunit [Kaistia dalseonensis]|uniref:Xanthine dehydrogenase small subunit n=1 Tax=Kaistia dalseonensis TaxID=410840 RepID=A0ABU0H2L9_9HYPH|nr:xanthine dehydrogenase small subunit [Kaistia dalseonensis]MCX5493970.1 xanthine dehydrogenase small subunit [Kaistia dalseonensis]MDQ0436546.1 xanthine dehydrogenase small subunit [Kaistia dalseonensis]